MEIIATLEAQRSELTARLTELDEKVNTERPGLVTQIGQLNKAIKALSKPVKTPGERKEMSPEAKANIRAGLERARAAKQAQVAGTTEAKPGSAPAASTDKKGPATEKGPARAN